MARPPEKLAESLEILRKLQNAKGAAAIRARDLTRTHRERLLKNGFLQEVIKGWYIPSRPDEVKGESTAWYASFWRFGAAYLERVSARTGACLRNNRCRFTPATGPFPASSPRGRPAGNKVTKLPHGTSLLDLRIALPASRTERKRRPAAVLVESALIAGSPLFFEQRHRRPRRPADDPRRLRPAGADCWTADTA